MKHVKIKTEIDYLVHFESFYTDQTLCGLVTSGDDDLGIEDAEETNKKVNCSVCISIVKDCKEIKNAEYN